MARLLVLRMSGSCLIEETMDRRGRRVPMPVLFGRGGCQGHDLGLIHLGETGAMIDMRGVDLGNAGNAVHRRMMIGTSVGGLRLSISWLIYE